MASEQARRDNTTNEREIHVEKYTVPKMTIHFESMAEKPRDSDITGGKETPHESGKDQSHDSRARSGNTVGEVGAPGKTRESHELATHEFESPAVKVKDMDVTGEKAREHGKDRERESYADQAWSANIVTDKEAEDKRGREEHEKTRGPHTVGKFEMTGEESREEKERERETLFQEEVRGKQEQPSLEQISKARAVAQQNSMEALKAAEERYNEAKEEARRKLSSATEYAAEKGSQAKDTVLQGAQKTSQLLAEKGSQAKDTVLEKGQQGYEATKETVYNVGKTAKDYTVPKAEQAKGYTVEKATEAKETAVDTTKRVASYTEEKVAAAKDATVESGKGVAEYAGKVAGDVKDKAVVAGWSTAHYTTEKAVDGTAAVAKAAQYTTDKAVEGTKAAVRAVEGVVEYAGHKAAEIVSKPLGAAKEAAVSTGETMKEYTARKKEEAERELDAKRSSGRRQDTERSYLGGDNEGEQESLTTKAEDVVEEVARPFASTIQEITFQGAPEQGQREKAGTEYRREENRGGVLQAIGETVVEFAQTTKDLVLGEGEPGEKILGYGSNKAEERKQEEARHAR